MLFWSQYNVLTLWKEFLLQAWNKQSLSALRLFLWVRNAWVSKLLSQKAVVSLNSCVHYMGKKVSNLKVANLIKCSYIKYWTKKNINYSYSNYRFLPDINQVTDIFSDVRESNKKNLRDPSRSGSFLKRTLLLAGFWDPEDRSWSCLLP